jgi:hypothetical protein
MQDLIDAAGIAKIGVDLYLLTMPADVQDGVMIRPPLTGDAIDCEQPGFYKSEFLIIVRHDDVEIAEAKCQQISELLTFYRRTIDNVFYTQVYPRTKPIPYPRSGAGTIEWGIPFEIAWGEGA